MYKYQIRWLMPLLILMACAPATATPRAGGSDNVAITIIYAPTTVPTESPESRSAVLSSPSLELPSTTKIPDTSLTWRECAMTGDFQAQQINTCFGSIDLPPTPTPAPDLPPGEMRLKIGSDTYRTTLFKSDYFAEKQCFNLHKNTVLLTTLCGKTAGFNPSYSLQAIGNKSAWEFIDGSKGYVIYEGKDMAQTLNLDSAFRPFELDDKLIFIGKKADRYVVVYNQQVIGPEFDLIHIAHCCESAAWSVRHGIDKYWFWAKRNGQNYVIEISS